MIPYLEATPIVRYWLVSDAVRPTAFHPRAMGRGVLCRMAFDLVSQQVAIVRIEGFPTVRLALGAFLPLLAWKPPIWGPIRFVQLGCALSYFGFSRWNIALKIVTVRHR